MPFYKVEGSIPKKRHTVFKNPKGGIYYVAVVVENIIIKILI